MSPQVSHPPPASRSTPGVIFKAACRHRNYSSKVSRTNAAYLEYCQYSRFGCFRLTLSIALYTIGISTQPPANTRTSTDRYTVKQPRHDDKIDWIPHSNQAAAPISQRPLLITPTKPRIPQVLNQVSLYTRLLVSNKPSKAPFPNHLFPGASTALSVAIALPATGVNG